jgi:hypothetical protein
MAISIDCKRCKQPITAENEDDLVAQETCLPPRHRAAG